MNAVGSNVAQEAPGKREALPPTLSERLAKWVWRAAVGGLVMSVLAHVIFLIVSAFILIGGSGSQGGAPSEDAGVDVAFMSQGELDAALAGTSVELQTPTVPDLTVNDPRVEEATDAAPDDGLSRSETPMTDVGPLTGGGDVSGGGSGLGDGSGSGGGSGGAGGGGSSFFGVEAEGNRFVYIVDVSGSMEGQRLATLQQELTRSIENLLETSQFLIVPFSSGAQLLGGRETWTDASATGKRWARSQLAVLQASGGTEPLEAFQIALRLRPRPDAIYFMTDGEFPEEMTEQILALNRSARVTIHCICFGSQAGEPQLRRIARGSRGTFTFVAQP